MLSESYLCTSVGIRNTDLLCEVRHANTHAYAHKHTNRVGLRLGGYVANISTREPLHVLNLNEKAKKNKKIKKVLCLSGINEHWPATHYVVFIFPPLTSSQFRDEKKRRKTAPYSPLSASPPQPLQLGWWR